MAKGLKQEEAWGNAAKVPGIIPPREVREAWEQDGAAAEAKDRAEVSAEVKVVAEVSAGAVVTDNL